MGLIADTITSVCINITDPSERDACLKGLSALSKTNDTDKMLDNGQDKFNKYLIRDATDAFGENGAKWIGGSLYLVKIAVDKGVTLSMPTLGLADGISSIVGPNTYLVRLEWRL